MTILTIIDGKYYDKDNIEFIVTDEMIKFIPKEGQLIIFTDADEQARFIGGLQTAISQTVDNYILNFV